MKNLTIWKFELEITAVQTIVMPENALIMSMQAQSGKVCIWALVNPDGGGVKRTFECFGTGHLVPFEHERRFIGTIQTMGGSLVWHFFERL